MRLVVSRTSARLVLRWTQYSLLAGALSVFCYTGFVLADTWIFQVRENRHLDSLLHNVRAATNRTPLAAVGGLIGRITIPRLGVSVIIAEGVDNITLRRAAGHIPGTALPGHAGNIGISAHRDTFFRPLRNIRRDDIITLTTLLGEFHYRVMWTKVVHPNDVAVLDRSEKEILTLVTCYPFYFIGPAPYRFIVRAERVESRTSS